MIAASFLPAERDALERRGHELRAALGELLRICIATDADFEADCCTETEYRAALAGAAAALGAELPAGLLQVWKESDQS